MINNYKSISTEYRFIFVIRQEDADKYHLDKALRLITDHQCIIVTLTGETKGAVCSALMAIKHINNDDELIIANGDQLLETNLDAVLKTFRKKNLDGGLICFESIHPKWSYARIENDKIIETAEKKPISRNAIAGFYYFREGKLFVKAAMSSIQKDSNVNGLYFISLTYNELILEGKNLEIFMINEKQYHSFYSPQKIKEYEATHKPQ